MKKLFLAIVFTLLPFGGIYAQSPTPTSPPASVEASLVSPDTGINYTPLRDLLAAQRWRSANEKTVELMRQASGREKQGWVTTDAIRKFPCADLAITDRLWRQYSNDRFGFSVQFKIFTDTGNKPGKLVAVEAYQDFGDRIGWRKGEDWITFKENLNYTIDAPVGHLPAPRDAYQFSGGRLQFTYLTQRMIDCKIVSYTPPTPASMPTP